MFGVAVGVVYQPLLVPGPLEAMCVGLGACQTPGPTMEAVLCQVYERLSLLSMQRPSALRSYEATVSLP